MVWVSEMIEVKVRPFGNAFGVILPKAIMDGEKIGKGEMINLIVLKKKKIDFDLLFGIAKGLGPFERDHTDREFLR